MVKLFALVSIALAASLSAEPVWYKPAKVYSKKFDTSRAVNNANYIINPDLSAVTDEAGSFNVPRKYIKEDGNALVEMTQAEKDAVDAVEAPKIAAGVKESRIQAGARLAAIEALLTHGLITQAKRDAWIAKELE